MEIKIKETQFQKVVKTLKNGWHNYGQMIEINGFASSLPRSTAKLREQVDKKNADFATGLIGTLFFDGKKYLWYEKLKGQVKYFKLVEIEDKEDKINEI